MSDLGKLFTTVKVDLLAADTTRTLVAAPGDGVVIRVFRILYISKTSASQALNVATGATNFLNLAIDISAHVIIDTGWLDGGIAGVDNTALIATPAAAGPAGSFYVTYVTEAA
jgi:hypothetical protein